jgi:hypothetical protein
MTTQQKVEAHIRKEIPELMELSFGCEVEWENPPFRAIYRGLVTTVNPAGEFQVDTPSCNWLTEEKNLRKIIGHPINIGHYLRVLEKSLQSHGDIKTADFYMGNQIEFILKDDRAIMFDLLTQQPAT